MSWIKAIEDTSAWLLPATFLAAGFVVGLVVERIVLRRLQKIARRTDWQWDDFLVGSLGHAPLLLFTAAGAYAAAIQSPLAVSQEVLNTILSVLLILAATLVTARMAAQLARHWVARTSSGTAATELVGNLTKVLVFVLGLLVILQTLDVKISPIIASLGIGGLAVALALQSTLANLFAGFQILAARQVGAGDYVKLETGEEGYVVDIRWRNTTIKGLFDDHEIVVPNSKLADSIVTNYALPRRVLWARMEVGVHYDSDLDEVERVSLEVAREVVKEHAGEVFDLEPVLRFQSFGDSSIVFAIRMPVEEFSAQFRLRHEFVKRLHRRYAEEGIVIPFPIRTLHLPEALRVERDGGTSTGRTS